MKKGEIMNNKLIKIILLITMIVLSLTGCKKRPASEGIETDEILISVSYADESFLKKYKKYVSYSENEEYDHRIAFIPNIPVKNFSWLEIGIGFDETSDRLFFEIRKVLYELEELHPKKPFVVSLTEAEIMSAFGFSYLDKNEQKKYFIGQAGNYGENIDEYKGLNFLISEFYPWQIVTGRYQYKAEPYDDVTFILDLSQNSYTLQVNDVVYTDAAIIEIGDIGTGKDTWFVILKDIKWAWWNFDTENDSPPSSVFLWLEEDNVLVFQNYGGPDFPFTIFNEIGEKWVRLTK
jgi:hypothetical protein